MALITVPSFAHALAVKGWLESSEEFAFDIKRTVFLEAYQNGREQGILIHDYTNDTAYYVSHHRNSDKLIVYVGKYAMQSISEDAYRHAHSFKGIEECSEWLIAELLSKEPKETTHA